MTRRKRLVMHCDNGGSVEVSFPVGGLTLADAKRFEALARRVVREMRIETFQQAAQAGKVTEWADEVAQFSVKHMSRKLT